MRKDAEAHADEDKKRKDLIEARNNADNTIYSTEKTIKDLGDKVPADMKAKAEEATSKLRALMSGEDSDGIKTATEELTAILQGIGSAAYQQGTPPAGETDQPGNDTGNPGGQAPGGEDVVDGEFKSM